MHNRAYIVKSEIHNKEYLVIPRQLKVCETLLSFNFDCQWKEDTIQKFELKTNGDLTVVTWVHFSVMKQKVRSRWMRQLQSTEDILKILKHPQPYLDDEM